MKMMESLENKSKTRLRRPIFPLWLYTIITVLKQSQRVLLKLFMGYIMVWGIFTVFLVLITSTSDIEYVTTGNLTAADIDTFFVFLEKSIRVFVLLAAIVFIVFHSSMKRDVSLLSEILAVLIFFILLFQFGFFIGVCVYCLVVWTVWEFVYFYLRIKTHKKIMLDYDGLVGKYGRIMADEMIREGFPVQPSMCDGSAGQPEEKE